jgi:hypothetical protein
LKRADPLPLDCAPDATLTKVGGGDEGDQPQPGAVETLTVKSPPAGSSWRFPGLTV